MRYAEGSLVKCKKRDRWWLLACPLIWMNRYRITEAKVFNNIEGYKIGGWWVQVESLMPAEYIPQVGDGVRVALRVSEEPGWENVWVAAMDDFVGKMFTISEINHSGVKFKENREFGFPPSCLEPV